MCDIVVRSPSQKFLKWMYQPRPLSRGNGVKGELAHIGSGECGFGNERECNEGLSSLISLYPISLLFIVLGAVFLF